MKPRQLFLMLLGVLFTLSAFARDFNYRYEGQTLTYEILDEDAKTCQPRGAGYYGNEVICGNNVTGDLVIPSVAKDGDAEYVVIAIPSYAFFSCSRLTTVTLPNSITSIGQFAFDGCNGLTQVNMGTSVQTIGYAAFAECGSLTSIVIPESVVRIEPWAFGDCSALKEVVIPNSIYRIEYSTFRRCTALESIVIPEYVHDFGLDAFEGCTSLAKAEFASIKVLCRNSFANKSANPLYYAHNLYIDGEEVKELYIPETVKYVNQYVFAGCSSITKLDLGTTVISIGEYAFSDCSSLTELTIPNSVNTIQNSAFEGCTSLSDVIFNASDCMTVGYSVFPPTIQNVTIGDGVKKLPSRIFQYCKELTSITIPQSVEYVDYDAFEGCTGLTKAEFASIESLCNIEFKGYDSNPLYLAHNLYIGGEEIKELRIPESVASIGANAFAGGSGLTSVTIPNTVTSIGSWAFAECTGLTEITIPNSVSTIGGASFYGCSGLLSINLANSITHIGPNAFSDCTGLTSIALPASVVSIERSAFYGCSGLTSITIPEAVTYIGESAFAQCPDLTEVFFNAINCEVCGPENLRLPQSAFPSSLKKVIIGNDVKSIPDFAFYGHSGLTEVTIGTSVLSIGDHTFEKCTGLVSIVLPESLTTIGYKAFSESGLKSITCPKSLASIGSGAFMSCGNLETVNSYAVETIGNTAFAYCSNLKVVNLAKIISIGVSAFKDCSSLEYILIPKSIQTIGFAAFYGCDGLDKVNILSPNLWSQIGFGSYSGNPIYSAKGFVVAGKDVKHPDLDINDCSVKADAFYNAENLTTIRVNGKGVGIRSFELCTNVASVCLDVDFLSANSFADCDNLSFVYSMTEEPPVAPDNAFTKYDRMLLYVPFGSKSKYENAECWNKFQTIIETDFAGIDTIFRPDYFDNERPDGIEDIRIDNSSSEIDYNATVEVYNLNGVKVADSTDNLAPGLYILRQGRSVKKIVIY